MIESLLIVGLGLSLAATPAPQTRRFALIAGANEGGAGRIALRYAASDARAVARVFETLGGVAEQDRLLLLQPNRVGFDRALATLRDRLVGLPPESRTEVVVYYSGHSDEGGLLLGEDRLPYADLRRALNALPADVKIAVLDSCASGALTRSKGGIPRPAFLVDTSSRVRGHAFVTSSSADEVAQESDRIGASFFTHFLLTGLRGAADVTRDGRVTLNEAYQFAFNETLARTERTRGGPQHPAYDIQLVGSGDIVMTDLRGTPAGIRMSPELSGRVFLRTEQGQLVAELNKISGHALELGLEPGRYQVTVEREGQLRTAHLEVTPGRTARLELTQLVPITPEVTASRGSSGQPDLSIPLAASLIPGFSTNGRREAEVTNNLTIGLVSRAAGLQGFGLTIVGSVITRRVAGIQLSGGLNSSGDLRGLQIAGGVNGVGWGTPPSKATGWQLATIANSVRGRVTGAQTALGFNGVSERVNGAQFAGVNLVGSELRGLQLGGANLVPHAAGVQLGGLNAAQRVHGVQAGAVNASATVRGLQIGAVNIAEDADATFGLINLVKNGYNHLAFWGSETNPGNVGLKYGGTHLYALLTAGLRPGPVPDRRYSFGFGFGGHIPVRAFFVDIEALASQVHHPDIRFKDEADNLLSTFRVSVGWQAFRHFAVFAGPSLNVFYVSDRETYRGDVGGGRDLMDQDEAVLCIFPGFQLGMQI